jgi:hypothetical protein
MPKKENYGDQIFFSETSSPQVVDLQPPRSASCFEHEGEVFMASILEDPLLLLSRKGLDVNTEIAVIKTVWKNVRLDSRTFVKQRRVEMLGLLGKDDLSQLRDSDREELKKLLGQLCLGEISLEELLEELDSSKELP